MHRARNLSFARIPLILVLGMGTPAAAVLAAPPALAGLVAPDSLDFPVLATLDIGRNPHQIAFSEDGATVYVATAGEDRITKVDADAYTVLGTVPVAGTPLGVVPLAGGDLAVARFQRGGVVRIRPGDGAVTDSLGTGPGASLFAGPYPGSLYLVSVESADSVHVFDAATFAFDDSYPTGRRPFPGAATSDGRVAFVPNYDDGTVTVIDLWNRRVLETVPVGERPSGGVVLPGDIDYAVAVRGENRVALINTASHFVVGSLDVGNSPFSVVLAPNGRLAFVNNTAGNSVSVISVADRREIARLPVADQPIVMAVHPSGRTLWVSSEGVHRLTVFGIPETWQGAAREAGSGGVTEVAIMRMIHSQHRSSVRWGLKQVRETIVRFKPDVVCAEIAPDRWRRIVSDLTQRSVIEDPRVLRFPEYTDVILQLSRRMGFEVVPCAGWTQEMSDLRETRIHAFETEERYRTAREAYARRLAAVEAKYAADTARADDPFYIHSDAYDRWQRAELDLYDEYQNDLIGPGGWTNINDAHFRYIDRTIRANRGRRVLITFGAGHKYMFLDRLRGRKDVKLIDLRPYLPVVRAEDGR